MQKIFSIIIFFIALVAVTSVLFSAEDNWNKEFTKDGITVYTRAVEGSSLKEFKGEGLINAPIDFCMNVMNDVESQIRWRPDCIAAKLIKREGNSAVSYSETKAPWPVSNRDVVVKTDVSKSGDKIIYAFTGVDDPNLVPVKSGVVRITEITGQWVLEPKGSDTLIIFQAKINPGGSLPAWLANKTAVDQPYKSLLGMREIVKDPKYQVK